MLVENASTGAAVRRSRTSRALCLDSAPSRGHDPFSMRLFKDHPWVTLLIALFGIVGMALGPTLTSQEWPLWRQLVGGLVGGLSCGLIIMATRLMGAFSEDDDEP